MKIAFVVALAATLLGTAVQAQEWVPVQNSPTALLGFDKSNLRDTSEGRTAWTITVFDTTRADNGDRYDYVITRQVFDCDQERSKSQVARAFLLNATTPSFTITEESEWDFHQPESIAGSLLNAVCHPELLGEAEHWSSAGKFASEARDYLSK